MPDFVLTLLVACLGTSGQDGNVWAPGSVGASWEDLGEVAP